MDAYGYAMLSGDAYVTVPTLGLEAGSARAVFAHPDDGLAIGFPGTNNIASLETDIDAIPHNGLSIGWVHKGTNDALQTILPALMQQRPEVVYGHSLGAMLALLYAGNLCAAGTPPKAVYAYEPAKVSIDGMLAALFRKYGVKVFLTRNGCDFVPTIPEIPFVKWQHPADVILLGPAKLPFPNVEDHMIAQVALNVRLYLEHQRTI